jgi:predicted transposase YdaD
MEEILMVKTILEEREERGEIRGEIKAKEKVAVNGLLKGYTVEQLSELTDLTEARVEEIKKELSSPKKPA